MDLAVHNHIKSIALPAIATGIYGFDFNDASELLILANRIVQALKSPVITIDGTNIFMGISIGIAIYPDQVKNMKALISAADEAMYQAKTTGKNHAVLHE